MFDPRRIASWLASAAAGAAMLGSAPFATAQQPAQTTATSPNATPTTPNPKTIDQDIDMLRKDVRSQKKQLIAANLKLTDQEAEKFWPIYDQYTAELVKINDVKYAVIKEYALNYGQMSDQQFDTSVQKMLQLDEQVAQLRIKYQPIFRGALSAQNTARFFQLDRRLTGIIDLQLADVIPLAGG